MRESNSEYGQGATYKDARILEATEPKPVVEKTLVVNAEEMPADIFFRHVRARHPALRPRSYRGGRRQPPPTRDGHLAAHRDWPHAHIHVCVAEPDADVAAVAPGVMRMAAG